MRIITKIPSIATDYDNLFSNTEVIANRNPGREYLMEHRAQTEQISN